jgi:hypothetical protein
MNYDRKFEQRTRDLSNLKSSPEISALQWICPVVNCLQWITLHIFSLMNCLRWNFSIVISPLCGKLISGELPTFFNRPFYLAVNCLRWISFAGNCLRWIIFVVNCLRCPTDFFLAVNCLRWFFYCFFLWWIVCGEFSYNELLCGEFLLWWTVCDEFSYWFYSCGE